MECCRKVVEVSCMGGSLPAEIICDIQIPAVLMKPHLSWLQLSIDLFLALWEQADIIIL